MKGQPSRGSFGVPLQQSSVWRRFGPWLNNGGNFNIQMDLPSDLIDLLAAFEEASVEYLLVGGQAVALHGSPRFTKDADLWLRDTADNITATTRALSQFGAPATTIEALGAARGLDVVWMGHPPARIDLMINVPGGDFDFAWQRRSVFESGGVTICCIDREELIRLKRASGRPQDLVDADLLEASEQED